MGYIKAANPVGRIPQVSTQSGYAVDDTSVAVMHFLKCRVEW